MSLDFLAKLFYAQYFLKLLEKCVEVLEYVSIFRISKKKAIKENNILTVTIYFLHKSNSSKLIFIRHSIIL